MTVDELADVIDSALEGIALIILIVLDHFVICRFFTIFYFWIFKKFWRFSE